MRRAGAGANVIPWRLVPIAAAALAIVDGLRPLGDGGWWAGGAATLVTATVLCWRATIDTDAPAARAAVVGIQIPMLAATFAAISWVTRWWVVAPLL